MSARKVLRYWTEELGPCDEFKSRFTEFTIYMDNPDTVERLDTIVAYGNVGSINSAVSFEE